MTHGSCMLLVTGFHLYVYIWAERSMVRRIVLPKNITQWPCCLSLNNSIQSTTPSPLLGRDVFPRGYSHMGFIGMCGPKGYEFFAILYEIGYGLCLDWCWQAYLTPIIWLLHMTCIIYCFLLIFGLLKFLLPNKSIQTLSSKLVRTKGSRDGVVVTVSPAYVSWVWFPDPASHVSWVCYWFSTLLREVFLQILQFSPLLKKTTFPNSNSTLECTGISERVLVISLVLHG